MCLERTGLFERRFHLYSVRQIDVQQRFVVAGRKLLNRPRANMMLTSPTKT